MVERIDVLLPPAQRLGYGVLSYFTRCMTAALARQGVQCRALGGDAGLSPEVVASLARDQPDCTLSFNGLLPDEDGRFLCDLIQVPHVACLVDSPNKFFPLAHSAGTLVASVDRHWAQFMQQLGRKEVLFLPHAADVSLEQSPTSERLYPVSFLGTCFDVDALRTAWSGYYPTALCAVMDAAVELLFTDSTISYITAFTMAMDQRLKARGDLDPRQLNLAQVLEDIELVARGRDRIALLRALKGVPVHVFGLTNGGMAGWSHYLAGHEDHITVHPPISHQQALAVMKQSRVVLNSCPSIKAGAHERLLSAPVAGAAVVTNDSQYIREIFDADHDLILYRHDNLQAVREQVVSLLENEADRVDMVVRCRTKVLAEHTWDHRARALLTYLRCKLPLPDVWHS